MKGKPIKRNGEKDRKNLREDAAFDSFLNRKTLYGWRKNTANEIQFKLKNKMDFIQFFIKNQN